MKKFALYGLLTSIFQMTIDGVGFTLHANHLPGSGFFLGMFRRLPN